MSKTYVPGYGYVDSNDPGTSGSVTSGPKPYDSGQGNYQGSGGGGTGGGRYADNPGPSTTTTTRVNYDLEVYIQQELSRASAESNLPDGTSRWQPGVLNTYGQPTSDWRNAGYIPIGSGSSGGYSGIPLTSAGWVPRNIASQEEFYGGGYFSGKAGREFALQLEALARTKHSNSTGGSMWDAFTKQSLFLADSGIIKSPYDLAAEWAADGGGVYWEARGLPNPGMGDGGGGGGGGYYGGGGGYYGGGGYSGGGGGGSGDGQTQRATRFDLSNEEDARAVIDTLAMQMLGRNVTDNEFSRFYSQLVSLERANPTKVKATTNEDGSVTETVTEQGLSAEARTKALRDMLKGSDDYAEYTIGTTALGLMANYLRAKGVFGG